MTHARVDQASPIPGVALGLLGAGLLWFAHWLSAGVDTLDVFGGDE